MNCLHFARCGLAAALLLGASVHAAENYPARPLRIVVAAAPGGGNDTAARLVGARLSEAFGQQVVVDNRPSGGGVIAGEIVARSAADGYTLLVAASAFTAAPGLIRKLPYDTLRDFAPITRMGFVPAALIVHPSLPVRTAKEFLALARSKPGAIPYGSAGVGTGSHLGGELFKLTQKVDLIHVPYKGSSLVTTALLSGEVMVAITNPLSSLPHVKAGRLRNFGLAHPERWPLLPEYPTLTEAGIPDFEMALWNGFVARAGTPAAIIGKLHAEMLKAAQHPAVVNALASDGSRPMPQSPADFGRYLREEVDKWTKVAKAAGIQPQ